MQGAAKTTFQSSLVGGFRMVLGPLAGLKCGAYLDRRVRRGCPACFFLVGQWFLVQCLRLPDDGVGAQGFQGRVGRPVRFV
jgi:hypothetical protein